MSKVILVLCDALRDDIARTHMGYLQLLVEQEQATRYTVRASLPAMSLPLYETIHTGVPANEHGILSNIQVRRSSMPNIFQSAVDAGLTTAAAAYKWFCELYVKTPFDIVMDREIDGDHYAIQHGRYYTESEFPDIELFATGAMLLQRHVPDYLLFHPLSLDTIGHKHGGESSEYRNAVVLQDQIIANLAPIAVQFGYTVIVTGDHGMDADKNHNGTLPDVRHVPLYVIDPENRFPGGDTGETVSQLQIAPTICKLLGIGIPDTMKAPPLLD